MRIARPSLETVITLNSVEDGTCSPRPTPVVNKASAMKRPLSSHSPFPLFLPVLLVALAAGTGCANHEPASAPPGSVAFVGDFFDGHGTVTRHGVVVIDGGTIHCAGTAPECSVAGADRVIRVEDGMILPGLIDLHVHARPHFIGAFPAAGVTTVRDANNTLATLRALRHHPDAPRILAAGPMLDGPESVLNGMSETEGYPGEQPWDSIMPVLVGTADDAREAVRALGARHVDVIKLYEQLPPEAYATAVQEAHALGLPVMTDLGLAATRGLTQARVDALQAAAYGVNSVEHLSGFALAYRRMGGDLDVEPLDDDLLDAIADEFARTDAAVVPTLVNVIHAAGDEPPDLSGVPLADAGETLMGEWWRQLFAIVHSDDMREREMIDFRLTRALLPRLLERGVLVGAGTDTPAGAYTVPGGGLHQELVGLVDFGLSPIEALQAATGNAARILGRDDLGAIHAGAKADLVIVSGDPTADIANSRRLEWIVIDGNVEPAEARQARFRESVIEASGSSMPEGETGSG